LFFEADFNVYLFKKRNESLILEYIIREYVAKTEPIRMRAEILKMVKEYDERRVLSIHPLFPSSSILNGLKQMYILYLIRKHTVDGKIYDNYGAELIYRMNHFIEKNPQFGRMNFQSNPKSMTLSVDRIASLACALTPLSLVSINSFVFGEPNPVSSTNTYVENSTDEAPNVATDSLAPGIPQPSRFIFHHRNTVANPGYSEATPYIRSPDIVQEFLENHQYNETSYNRYVYSGSIYSAEQPLPYVVTEETETDEEDYVLRAQHPRHDNVSVEEAHAVTSLAHLRDSSISASLHIRRATPIMPENIMTVYYYYGNDGDTNATNNEDNQDNQDNNTTSTEEEQTDQTNRQYENIIAGDDSSIDSGGHYEDDDGYDSVS